MKCGNNFMKLLIWKNLHGSNANIVVSITLYSDQYINIVGIFNIPDCIQKAVTQRRQCNVTSMNVCHTKSRKQSKHLKMIKNQQRLLNLYSDGTLVSTI